MYLACVLHTAPPREVATKWCSLCLMCLLCAQRVSQLCMVLETTAALNMCVSCAPVVCMCVVPMCRHLVQEVGVHHIDGWGSPLSC